MKKLFYGFHGDVGLFKLNKIPKGAEFFGTVTKHVAQEGETTGHKHLIKSETQFDVYKLKEKDEHGEIVERWLYLLSAPAEISHEEHRTHILEPGIYYQDQENEESPQDGLIHKVVD